MEDVSWGGRVKKVLESDDGLMQKMSIVVLKSKVLEVLRYLHNGSSGGYLGVTNTLQKMRQWFYLVKCSEDVKEWYRR